MLSKRNLDFSKTKNINDIIEFEYFKFNNEVIKRLREEMKTLISNLISLQLTLQGKESMISSDHDDDIISIVEVNKGLKPSDESRLNGNNMDHKIPERLESNHTHETNDNKSGLGSFKKIGIMKRGNFHSLNVKKKRMKIDDKNTDGSVNNITNDSNDRKSEWGGTITHESKKRDKNTEKVTKERRGDNKTHESDMSDETAKIVKESSEKGRDSGITTKLYRNNLNVTGFAQMMMNGIERSLK